MKYTILILLLIVGVGVKAQTIDSSSTMLSNPTNWINGIFGDKLVKYDTIKAIIEIYGLGNPTSEQVETGYLKGYVVQALRYGEIPSKEGWEGTYIVGYYPAEYVSYLAMDRKAHLIQVINVILVNW